ncbi:MAG TPA: hypothetical protein VKB73_00850 [Gaiellaceae bacterium]|nr:hypothetical protein [Gaiellaceae bacterium]
MDDAFAREHLARARQGAEPRREIQCSAAVPALDADRLADVEADPDSERRGGIVDGLALEARLKVDRRPKCAPRRLEDRQGLVSAQLEELASDCSDLLANNPCELPREPRGRDITMLVGEARVATDIRDQERPYLSRFGTRVDVSV